MSVGRSTRHLAQLRGRGREPDGDAAMTDDAHQVSAAVADAFPALRSFVQWGFDMQLADAADLLRLPYPNARLS